MKLKTLIVVVGLLIGKKGASQVEASTSSFETNTISIYYPTYYFFDNMKYRLETPLANLGVSYERFKPEKKIGWHASIDHYWYGGPYPKPVYMGDVFDRDVLFVSLGLDNNLISRKNFILNWYGELNHRFGYEYWYSGGSGINWAGVQRKLIDFGLFIGAKCSYRFPFGLVASLSIRQGFYYYRFDRGIDYWTFEDGSPRNVLNLNFALGWNF